MLHPKTMPCRGGCGNKVGESVGREYQETSDKLETQSKVWEKGETDQELETLNQVYENLWQRQKTKILDEVEL